MTAKAAMTASRKVFCGRFIVRSFVATIGDEASRFSGRQVLDQPTHPIVRSHDYGSKRHARIACPPVSDGSD